MRGNHRIWGRQDYVEPAPLPSDLIARIEACTVTPRWPDRDNRWNWHEVALNGQLIGYVTTRLAGQQFRTPEMEFWCPVNEGANSTDPQHARAILCLLELGREGIAQA